MDSFSSMQHSLHLAAANGALAHLTQLLAADSGLVHALNAAHQTPLHEARDADVARLLIQYGAELNVRGGFKGETPLHVAAQQGHTEVVAVLLDAEADVNARNQVAETPLHLAATLEIARLLVAQGADLNALDHRQEPPLYRHLKQADMVAFLIGKGARVDLRDQVGRSPFHRAAEAGYVSCLAPLLAGGLEINEQDPVSGWTPLHEAVQHDRVAVVRWLLEHGADPQRRSLGGETPLDIALWRNHHVISLLLQAGLPLPHLRLVAPAEPLIAQQLRLHPTRREAVVIGQHGMLGRWHLGEPLERLLAVQLDVPEIRDVAVAPDGERVALATPEAAVELRAWEDFRLLARWPIPHQAGLAALAFAPNGRWLAIGGATEHIVLLEAATGQLVGELQGGEWNGALAFAPASDLLASACSYQGGGAIMLDHIGVEGQISRVQELDRSDMNTPPSRFVDTLPYLTFSPDGRWLALFETCSMPGDRRAATGWYGNLVLYAVASGNLQWEVALNARLTEEPAELGERLRGGRTEVTFLSAEEVGCGSPGGMMLCFDVETGRLRRRLRLQPSDAIISLASNTREQRLYAATRMGALAATSIS